jgi:hypothetical protein
MFRCSTYLTYNLFKIKEDDNYNIIITITIIEKYTFIHAYVHIKLNMFIITILSNASI